MQSPRSTEVFIVDESLPVRLRLAKLLGAMQEVITDGRTGLHFETGNASDLAEKVEWAWNHPSELIAMGHEARRDYEALYTPEANYSLLMSIYEQTLRLQSENVDQRSETIHVA